MDIPQKTFGNIYKTNTSNSFFTSIICSVKCHFVFLVLFDSESRNYNFSNFLFDNGLYNYFECFFSDIFQTTSSKGQMKSSHFSKFLVRFART